jgi:hypothetical protein
MIYLALWIVPALIVCVTLSFTFGALVGAIVSAFEKLPKRGDARQAASLSSSPMA